MNRPRCTFLAVGVLILAGFAVYQNTWAVPFLFDDMPSIVDNTSIRSLRTAFSPPVGFGATVSGRPLVNVSLALNYAISGQEVWSYHLANVLIHLVAGLLLFGLVRRLLRTPVAGPRLNGAADWTAWVVALCWLVHPLQTESVTYVVQRSEAMMAVCYLASCYAFVRATEPGAGRPALWFVLSVAMGAVGTGCKEVIATLPVAVWLMDRTFVAGGFWAAWRQRWRYYAALSGVTWGLLAVIVAGGGVDRGGTFHYTVEGFFGYWLTQFEAITRYLGLAFWPATQAFDYGFFRVQSIGQVLPYALVVVPLLGATVWALVRRPVAGFVGAVFFLILAPSSLMPGILQVIVEHRMYLPLAAVLALAGGVGAHYGGRRAVWVGCAAALALGWTTVRRNEVYATAMKLWTDTIAKRPMSAMAQSNVGLQYFLRGDLDRAIQHYRESIRLEPNIAQQHFNLALAYEQAGRLVEAEASYRRAVGILPYYSHARIKLAGVLRTRGAWDEALEHLRIALSYIPELAEGYFTLGQIKAEQGQPEVAIKAYREALRYETDFGAAQLNLGILLAQQQRFPEALTTLQALVTKHPALPEAQANLGIVLAEMGRPDAAIGCYERALRLRPDYAMAHYNLGNALVQLQRWPEAKRHFAEAVRLQPQFEAAREMLEKLRMVF